MSHGKSVGLTYVLVVVVVFVETAEVDVEGCVGAGVVDAMTLISGSKLYRTINSAAVR